MRLRPTLLGLAVLSSGCITWVKTGNEESSSDSLSVPPEQRLNDGIAALLRPGGAVVLPFTLQPAGAIAFRTRAWQGPGGAVALLWSESGTEQQAIVHVSSAGTLTVSATKLRGDVTAAPLAGGLLLAACGSAPVLVDAVGQATELSGARPLADCGTRNGIVGAGSTADRLVAVHGSTATVWSYTAGALTEQATLALSGVPDDAAARFADEPAGGTVTALFEGAGDDTWFYGRSDGPAMSAALPDDLGPSSDVARREASGALLLASSRALHRWNVQADGSVELLDTSQAPDLAADWSSAGWFGGAVARFAAPDPADATGMATLPPEFRVRGIVDTGFRSLPAPQTPCATIEECRRVGDSELLGVVGFGTAPVGLYRLWAWEQKACPDVALAQMCFLDVTAVLAVPLQP